MKKKFKLFLATILASCCCATTAVLAGCGEEESPQATTYTVTFNSNGGSAVEDLEVSSKDTFITEPNDPTKEGYTFAYWALNGNEFDFGAPPTGDVELNAVWTPVEYAITYQGDGTMPSTGLTYNVENRATFTLPTPTRDGYEFAGWVDSENEPVTSLAEKTGAITLTATWTIKTYNITYVGEGTMPQAGTYTVENRGTTVLSEPSRDYYEFAGWVDSENESVTSLADKLGDITLTATWTPVAWDILYTGDGVMPTENRTYTIENRETFVLPEATRDGYEFAGWVDSENEPVTSLADKTDVVLLLATWTVETYNITYVGEGTMPQAGTYTIENRGSTTLSEPSRDYYEFAGWVDSENEPVTSLAGMLGDITLTATWTPEAWAITYTGEGELPTQGSYNIETRETFTLPTPTHSNAGYVFVNWVDGDDNPVTSLAEKTGAITLEAIWRDDNDYDYTVRWLKEGDVEIKSEIRQAKKDVEIKITPDEYFLYDNVYYKANSTAQVSTTVTTDGLAVVTMSYATVKEFGAIANVDLSFDAQDELVYTTKKDDEFRHVFDATASRYASVEATILPATSPLPVWTTGTESTYVDLGTGLAIRDESGNILHFMLGNWGKKIYLRINNNGAKNVAEFGNDAITAVFTKLQSAAGATVTMRLTAEDGTYKLYNKVDNGYQLLLTYAPSEDVTLEGDTFHVADDVQVGFRSYKNASSHATVSKLSFSYDKTDWADLNAFTTKDVVTPIFRQDGFTVPNIGSGSTYKLVTLNDDVATGTAITAEATFTWYGANHFNGGFAIKQGDKVIIFKLQNYNPAIAIQNSLGGTGYYGTKVSTVLGGSGTFAAGTPVTLRLVYYNGYVQIFMKDGENWVDFTPFVDVNVDTGNSGNSLDWGKDSTPITIDKSAPVTICFGFESNHTGNGHVDNISFVSGVSTEFANKVYVQENYDIANMNTVTGDASADTVSIANTDANPAGLRYLFKKQSGKTFTAEATLEYAGTKGYSGGFAIRQGGKFIYFAVYGIWGKEMDLMDSTEKSMALSVKDASIFGDGGTFGAGTPVDMKMVYTDGYVQFFVKNEGNYVAFTDVIDVGAPAHTWSGVTIDGAQDVEVGVAFWRDWGGESKINNLKVTNSASDDLTDGITALQASDANWLANNYETRSLTSITKNADGTVSLQVPSATTKSKYAFNKMTSKTYTVEADLVPQAANVGFSGGLAVKQGNNFMYFMFCSWSDKIIIGDVNDTHNNAHQVSVKISGVLGEIMKSGGTIKTRMTYDNGMVQFFIDQGEGWVEFTDVIDTTEIRTNLISIDGTADVQVGACFYFDWSGNARINNLKIDTALPTV